MEQMLMGEEKNDSLINENIRQSSFIKQMYAGDIVFLENDYLFDKDYN